MASFSNAVPTQPSAELANLELAVCSVLSGVPENVHRGNEYLIAFTETSAAWSAALSLFHHENASVQYFAANIINTKLNRHWDQLIDLQKEEIFQSLMNVLTKICSTDPENGTYGKMDGNLFANRIILALCCICCKIPNGVSIYIHAAMELIDKTPLDEFVITLGLAMLKDLPGEIETLSFSQQERELLQDELLRNFPPIMQKINIIASSPVWHTSHNTHVSCMKVIRCWLMHGMTLSKLFEEYEPCLTLISASLQSNNGEKVKEGCSVLREVVSVGDFPRSEIRDRAVLTVVSHMTSCSVYLAPFFDHTGESGDEDVAHEICNCMVSIACQEVDLVCSPESCNVDFINLLLELTKQKPRSIASLTFEVWVNLQEDLPVADRHPFLAQEVFYKLLEIILLQCTYPSDYTESWDDCDEDEDDFINFRKKESSQGLQDVLLCCCYALHNKFFEILCEKIRSASNWQILESVFFVLSLSMDAIKSQVKSDDNQAALSFILYVLNLLLSKEVQDLSKRQSELQKISCELISSLTFILAPKLNSNLRNKEIAVQISTLFVPCMQYLFDSVTSQVSSASAAKGIRMLCIHGVPALTEPVASGNLLIYCLMDSYMSGLFSNGAADTSSVLDIIEAVVRAITTLPAVDVIDRLFDLGEVIDNNILGHLSSGKNLDRIEILIKYAGQIIRFSDSRNDADDNNHVLVKFLQLLWPRLQQLESDVHLNKIPSIQIALLDLYGRALHSAGRLIISEVPRITHFAGQCFSSRSEASSASLSCATVIVDVLCGQRTDEINVFLSQLLGEMVSALHDHAKVANSTTPDDTIFGHSPECLEKFFRFIFSFIIHCPIILSDSPVLPQLMHLSAMTILSAKESTPLRSNLANIQAFFYPQMRQVDYESHRKLLSAAVVFGESFVTELFLLLNGRSGIPSTLWPNIIDTLYSIICGSSAEYAQNCQHWITVAVSSLPSEKFTNEAKSDFYNIIFKLTADPKYKSKFKSFFLDLINISVNSLDIIAIQPYLSIV